MTPLMAATERSISLTRSTNIKPKAMMPTTVLCSSRLDRFCADRKTSLWVAKKIHNAARPITTGSTRRSVASSSLKVRRFGGWVPNATGGEGACAICVSLMGTGTQPARFTLSLPPTMALTTCSPVTSLDLKLAAFAPSRMTSMRSVDLTTK